MWTKDLYTLWVLIGGKNFDKNKVLSAAITVSGKATAKCAAGLSMGGSDTATIERAPVSGIVTVKWKDNQITPPTPTPSPEYSDRVAGAANSGGGSDVKDWGGSDSKSNLEKANVPTVGGHYSLLGLNEPIIQVYGADEQPSSSNEVTYVGLIITVIVVAALMIFGKKKH
jgi:hypothetical protein